MSDPQREQQDKLIIININNNNRKKTYKSNADMDFVVGQISWETSHAQSIAELSIVRDTGERKEVRYTSNKCYSFRKDYRVSNCIVHAVYGL